MFMRLCGSLAGSVVMWSCGHVVWSLCLVVHGAVQAKADANAVTHGERLTPLMIACSIGSEQSTEALLQCGADYERCNFNNERALMIAAGNGRDEVCVGRGGGGCWPLQRTVRW
jgi:hypothetical protein